MELVMRRHMPQAVIPLYHRENGDSMREPGRLFPFRFAGIRTVVDPLVILMRPPVPEIEKDFPAR